MCRLARERRVQRVNKPLIGAMGFMVTTLELMLIMYNYEHYNLFCFDFDCLFVLNLATAMFFCYLVVWL